jgi:hypothetical protein
VELRPERPSLERIYFDVMGVSPRADEAVGGEEP